MKADPTFVFACALPTRFPHPKAVAVDDAGDVYVGSNGWAGGLEKLQRTSGRPMTFASAWSVEAGRVRGIGLLPDGTVCVSLRLMTGCDIHQYGPDGSRIAAWAPGGPGIRNPAGVATDPKGFVYVAETKAWDGRPDASYDRVQKLTAGGRFLAAWGESGQGDGQFNLPVGIAVGPDGVVYVADTYSSRIQAFSPAGAFLQKWGSFGHMGGEFNCPQGIAVSPDGRVYVADTCNNRIQVYQPDGTFEAAWGQRGSGEGEFWLPCGIAADGRGNVYIADTMNSRVQVFQLAPREAGRER